MQKFSISQIAEILEARVRLPQGCVAEKIQLSSITTLSDATSNDLTFLANPKYIHELATTKAGAVLIAPDRVDQAPEHLPLIIHDDPYLCFAKLLTLVSKHQQGKAKIAKSAIIAKSAKLGKNVTVAAGVVIEDDAIIGDNSIIKANATVCHGVQVGQNCIIHEGAVIGSDGFGNAWDKQNKCWVKVPQIGSVVIGDDVEIGANTTIDRGALKDTIIGNNVRIDNLVQIAHNVQIGDHTAIAAQTGIAGSTKIGKSCIFAGQVGVNGHIEICDGVIITGGSGITNTLEQSGIYSSTWPTKPVAQWRRNVAALSWVGDLIKRVRRLEKQVLNHEELT